MKKRSNKKNYLFGAFGGLTGSLGITPAGGLSRVWQRYFWVVGSMRPSVGGVLNPAARKAELLVLAQYFPNKPIPVPMAELLMKPALATPLLTAPGWAAMACTLALVVKTKGPV